MLEVVTSYKLPHAFSSEARRLPSTMSVSVHSSLLLLPLSKTPQQSSPAHTSRSLPVSNGYRISPRALTEKRRRPKQCRVATVEDVAEDVLLPREAEEVREVEEKYDWREEWYPLYLTAEVPEDAPLGLTVFHKQIVLYRDFNGVLRCYEDRCPHRYETQTVIAS